MFLSAKFEVFHKLEVETGLARAADELLKMFLPREKILLLVTVGDGELWFLSLSFPVSEHLYSSS